MNLGGTIKKATVLGAGFAGCTIAHLLHLEGWEVTVLEKDAVVGGGCRTYFYGGHPFTYGPRLYYGYSQKVYDWISKFLLMRKMPFELRSYVHQDQRFYSYPIHEDDIKVMHDREKIEAELEAVDREKEPTDFEDYWINRVGATLYGKFVDEYSKKMWALDSNKELDTFNWSAKDDPINRGLRYAYKTSIIAYPSELNGYNNYFDRTLEGSTLVLNAKIQEIDMDHKRVVLSDGRRYESDILVSSIPIEELCNFSLGDLPYMGRDFIVFVLPCKQVFPGDVRFCHYTQNEPYTRITEFKKLTYYDSEDTVMVMELPSNSNKLYPYMIKSHIERSKQYLKQVPDDVYSIGRLGTYKYSTIEQTISQSFKAFRKITGKSIEGIEQEFYNIGDVQSVKDRKAEDEG